MLNETKVIDGKALAEKWQSELAKKVAKLDKAPVLAVIMVGENEASEIYVRNKVKAAKKVGIDCRVIRFSQNVKSEELLSPRAYLASRGYDSRCHSSGASGG